MNNQARRKVWNYKNKEHFDRWSRTYDTGRISQWFRYTQGLVVNEMPLRKDSRILDIGCGTGSAVLLLATIVPDGKACGVDISKEMITQANQKIPVELSDRIEFREGSSDNIPYPDACFDNVLCTNSFHHYPDPIKALKEMQRVVKPGSEIFILENAPDLSWYTWLWDRVLRVIEPGHVRYYPSNELGHLIRRSGMDDVRLRYLGNERFKHGKLFASLQIWSGQRSKEIERR
jgi:ubiquinone/menaquinone biosynthesis C-methylase UbiE